MNAKIKIIITSIIIAISIELFICNAQELCALFADNKNIEPEFSISLYKIGYSDLYKENENTIESGVSVINIENLNTEVYNLRIYYKENYNVPLKYTPSIKVYGHSNSSLNFDSKEMVASKNNTYINFRSEDIVESLELSILHTDYQTLEIEKIVINSTKLNIKLLRIILLFITSMFILYIKDGKIYKTFFNPASRKQKYLYYGIILLFCLFLLIYYKDILFSSKNKIITQTPRSELMLLQTEAFLNGQLPLLNTPSDELLELSNPYDTSLRETVDYMWDASYYNGNYYQYFSVLPIILFEIPIKLLTGYYLTTASINILLLILTIFLIAKLTKSLITRYINKISLFNLILAQQTAIIASNVILLSRGGLYEICELLGIINLICSILIIFSIEKDNKINNIKLILIGITSALLVISKPTYIVWYLLIIPMLFKVLYEKNDKTINKSIIKKIVIYAIPIIIIAGIQMWYNYARYDNIFEFGAKYNLTIYDMNILMSFSLPKLIKGFVIYLVKMPTINIVSFPFITITDLEEISTSLGAITFEYGNLGLFAIPIFYALFMKNKFINNINSKENELNNILNITIISTIIIIIINITFAGMCEQYAIQYKIILVIFSILILLKGLEIKKISNFVLLILCITSIVITLPISLNTLNRFLQGNVTNLIIYLENMFQFWM